MQLTAVVLNAGLGELSIGLEQSGFKITAAYESDEKAWSIYELNMNMVIEPLPLEEIDAKSVPEADLLAAHLHIVPALSTADAFRVQKAQGKEKLQMEKLYDILGYCKPRAFLFFCQYIFFQEERIAGFFEKDGRGSLPDFMEPCRRSSDNWFSSAGADGLCCGNSSGTWQEF